MTRPETLEQLVQDRKAFIETTMELEDKQRRLVPFILNRIQQLELAEQSEWKRDIYVKPAQVGSTTLWAAVFLYDTMTTVGTTSVIVAHEEFITQRLLQKVQNLYDNMHPNFKVPMHRSSAYEKTFPDIKGTIYIGSARAYIFGRGEPIHNFLGSEVAFWPDANKIIDPSQDRVPMQGGTMVLESTPNGQDGPGAFFYHTYMGAKHGNNTWKHHYYPWWFHDEYQLPLGSPYALPEDRFTLDLTEEEFDLCRIHNLTEDHIRWRRRKMKDKQHDIETGETRLLFHQEFPENDETCFLSTGESAYDSLAVERLARMCYIAKESYDGAAVWYPPEEGRDYLVSIDPGMGKQSKSVIHVWTFYEDEDHNEIAQHCATSSGYFVAEIAAAKALNLAVHYHNAVIAPETNPPGLPIATILSKYPRMYLREDVISGRRGKVIGWLTTPRTKPFMISEVARLMPRMITHDINLVSQFRNMQFVGDRVQPMGPDDHHDACAIACACRRTARPNRGGYIGQAGWDDNWGISKGGRAW